MSHKQPTPEDQRPTFAELRLLREIHHPVKSDMIVRITADWVQVGAAFNILVAGDEDDIQELIETLRENGNLENIQCTVLEEGALERELP